MGTRKHKPHIAYILTLGLVWLILSANAVASDWFVRPAGGSYGTEDGSSYANSWDGLKSVVWGPGGVEPGDNLYVCGLHVHDMVSKSYTISQADIGPISSGTAGNRIIIRGDYPGDQGIVWGAHKISYEAWQSEGSNTYSVDYVGGGRDWYFEDITAESWVLLDVASDVGDCKATPGSVFVDVPGDRVYIHCSNN